MGIRDSDGGKSRVKNPESRRQDDFAAMHEVVSRRYGRVLEQDGALPDLILLDGGRGQLGAGLKALEALGLDYVPMVSLAKRAEEVYTPDRLEPLVLDLTSPALQALQKVRDEAHRFAITYHKKLRTRRTISSVLDQIPGVGPTLRTSLLKTLGSARAVRAASVGQLAAVPKVSPRLAQRIHELVDPDDVVIHVAEVRAHVVGDQVVVPAHEPVADVHQRRDGSLDVDEAPLEAVEHPGRSGTRDLDPYSVAETPAAQLALDRLAEIVRLVRQLEVGVPADSEDAALEDLHLREETSEEVADHALERQKEPALADRHEPRQELRHLDARESFLAAVRIADEEPE